MMLIASYKHQLEASYIIASWGDNVFSGDAFIYDPATAKAGAAPLPNLGALEACCYIYDPQSGHFSHAFQVSFQPLQQPQIRSMERSRLAKYDPANGMQKFQLVRKL